MRLVLVRHADAEDYAGSDFQRNLTAKGIKQARKVSTFLSGIEELDKSILIFSPYLRAAQTAKIITEGSEHYYTTIEDKRLGCGMTPAEAMEIFKELSFEDTVIMVGHEPDMGNLMAHLLGSPAHTLHVRKASVAIFEVEGMRQGGGILEAFVPCKYM